ncbi:hypothetical protein SAMD00079811_77240 (plasmid) [Scytonema sp. HK-05]|uniref:general stress protein n=1 Tax=Scytonema sp. HK-05 TaxID=1137095 RepID=UPI000937AB4E|nr:general stress protein [Scytonema sp. HK-05]OKH59421.1 hypothetical protein NIES2130_08840 [Scytonema sp. HK-05]BAY50095.1 hypothetical protein SAMD00079811_77240 [Scytonema sp. HK-05]
MIQHELIGIFSTQTEAENAVLELQKAGLDINKISIFSKDFQTRDFFSWKDTAKEGATEYGYWGTVLGAVLGTLTGTEFLLIPPIAQIIVAGPIFGLLLGAVQGLALGVAVGALVGALGGALFGELEIPIYENEIKAGKFALMTRGTSKEREKAIQVLKDAGYNIHEAIAV